MNVLDQAPPARSPNWSAPPDVIAELVRRGYPHHVAVGIAANWAAESGLNPSINEIAPIVPGSRGGRGYYQLTGPRRTEYEARYGDSYDPQTQFDFHDWELQNTERGAYDALMATTTPEEAAQVYSERFLRPGIPHLQSRIGYATQFASGDYDGVPATQYAGGSAPGNALASAEQAAPRENAMDALRRRQEERGPALNALDFQARPYQPQFQSLMRYLA